MDVALMKLHIPVNGPRQDLQQGGATARKINIKQKNYRPDDYEVELFFCFFDCVQQLYNNVENSFVNIFVLNAKSIFHEKLLPFTNS